MKYKAYITIQYRIRKLFKPFIIDKVIDLTHANKVLKYNLIKLYPGRRCEVVSIESID